MKCLQLAAELGVNRRTISRLIEKGLLESHLTPKGHEIAEVDANNLKAMIDAGNRLEGRVKELYVLRVFGTSFSHIQDEYGLSPDGVDLAYRLYSFERSQGLKQFSLGNIESDALFIDEVAARLKITDPHVVYELSETGALRIYGASVKGKKKYFPSKSSFADYLGADVKTIFYNSGEVSKKLGITVEKIDRIAKAYSIGRKIKADNKHSNYLFTPEDVHKIGYYKSNHAKKFK